MPFTNPIVGGNGALILPAIRSPNYVTGVAGWTINRDGSAEFADLIITGGEIRVTDPDGSYVRIYDENPGAGAIIELNPASFVPPQTVIPGRLGTNTANVPDRVTVSLTGAQINGLGAPAVVLSSSSVSGENLIQLGTNGITLVQNGLAAKELGFNKVVVNDTPPPAATTASATFVNITGATTGTFVKARDATSVEIVMTAGIFSSVAGGTTARYGLRFDDGVAPAFDITVGQVLLSVVSAENASAATIRIPGATIPSGTYTVTPRWLRSAGGGTLNINAQSASLTWSVSEVIET